MEDVALTGQQQSATTNTFSTSLFFGLAIALAATVLMQVLFAGMAIFVDPAGWMWHTTFVGLFGYIPPVMLIVAFAGRLPTWARWYSAGLLGLIWVQYLTANIGFVFSDARVVAALHPVTGFLFLAVTLRLIQRTVALRRTSTAWRMV